MAQNVEYIISLRDRFSGKLTSIQTRMQKFKASMTSMNATMNGLFVGAAVVMGAKNLLEAFNKQEQAIAQVRQGLLSTGNVAGRTLEQLRAQAAKLQKESLFGDEEILQGATAQLLTFTNIAGNEFDRTQQSILDVTSRLYGTEASAESLRSTSLQLGKALNDPVANLSALSRSGIQFTKEQKTMVNALWKTGRQAEAQALILTELEKQYGGSAAAAAAAGTGGLKQLGNIIGDLKEKMGAQLIPVVMKLTNGIKSFIGFIERNASTFKILFQVVVNALPILAALTAAFILLNLVMNANPIFLIITGVALLAGAMITLYQKSETFRNILTVIGNLLGIFFNILKKVGMYIFKYFAGQFIALIEIFKRVGNAIWVYLKAPFENIKAVIGSILDWITEKIQSFFRLLSKIPGVSKLISKFKDIGSKIGKGVSKGVTDGAKKVQAQVGIVGTTGVGGVGSEASAGAGATKETKITSAAPRVFNINIGSIGENMTIMSQTIKEGAGQAKQIVLNELLGALNDTQIVLNQ